MKKSNVIGLTVGIVVTIVVVSLISWFAIRPVPTLIQGEVEATDIKISSKLAGRIEQMDVQEGERVKKGPKRKPSSNRPKPRAWRPALKARKPVKERAYRRSKAR